MADDELGMADECAISVERDPSNYQDEGYARLTYVLVGTLLFLSTVGLVYLVQIAMALVGV